MTRKSDNHKSRISRAKALAARSERNGEEIDDEVELEENDFEIDEDDEVEEDSDAEGEEDEDDEVEREIEENEDDDEDKEADDAQVEEDEDDNASDGDDIEPEDDDVPDDSEDEDAAGSDGNDVVPDVGPETAKGTRLVICRRNGDEVRRHTFNTNNADKLTKFIRDVADEIKTAPENLAYLRRQIIEKAEAADKAVAAAVAEKKAQTAAHSGDRTAEISAKIVAETPEEFIKAAKSFLKNPDLFEELKRDIEVLGVVGEWLLALAVYLIGTSRIMAKTLGGLVQAASSTGKSYVSNMVVSLMPDEQVLKATDITGQALYYFRPGSLKHKFICVAERKHQESQDDAAAANAGLALREMFSSGELRKVVTVKEGGGMTTVEIRQEGPIAYLETTTQENIFGEDETRLMKLTADESPKQTQRVIEQLKREARGEVEPTQEQQAIRLKHQTAQRLLRPLRVIVPYADYLNIPTTKVAARRAYGQLIGCIQVVALLRQFQKKINNDGITADVEDYRIAYKIMRHVLRRTFAPVSQRAVELLATITANAEKLTGKFDRNDCVRWSGLSLTEVRNRITKLLEAGAITQVSGGPGQRYVYETAKDAESGSFTLKELVNPDQLEKLINDDEVEIE